MSWTPPWGEILEEEHGLEASLHGPSDDSPLADDFRSAMRHLAGGVSVVTVVSDGAMSGITATSVTSLSMAPPSLLISIRRTSSIITALRESRRFTTHILAEDQEHAAQAFAGRLGSGRRDSLVDWSAGPTGQRHLAGALCHVECSIGRIIPIYSHFIVIGLVEAVFAGAARRPLVYFDGGFSGLAIPATNGEKA